MCCFGVRVFLLFFITVLSFISYRLYPIFPTIIYYFIFANILSFIMFSLFFLQKLPQFVKPNSIHYFCLIGGFIGSILSMAIFKKIKKDIFTYIEFTISIFWIIAIYFGIENFEQIKNFIISI